MSGPGAAPGASGTKWGAAHPGLAEGPAESPATATLGPRPLQDILGTAGTGAPRAGTDTRGSGGPRPVRGGPGPGVSQAGASETQPGLRVRPHRPLRLRLQVVVLRRVPPTRGVPGLLVRAFIIVGGQRLDVVRDVGQQPVEGLRLGPLGRAIVAAHSRRRRGAHAALDAAEAVGEDAALADAHALQEALKVADVLVRDEGPHPCGAERPGDSSRFSPPPPTSEPPSSEI